MRLTLVGPDDSGFWHLENDNGMTWQVVERWADHPGAAALLGWTSLDAMTDDEQAEAAREFLMEHIGDQIEAPRHIAQHFEQRERETVEEERRVGFNIEGLQIEIEDE